MARFPSRGPHAVVNFVTESDSFKLKAFQTQRLGAVAIVLIDVLTLPILGVGENRGTMRGTILLSLALLALPGCRSYVVEEAAQRAISQDQPGTSVTGCHETTVVFQRKHEGPFFLCEYELDKALRAAKRAGDVVPTEGCFTIDLDAAGHAVAKESVRCFEQ
jgi:hypothetical protein